MTPRVACTTNETVRKGFVSGEFSVTIDSICQRTRAGYLSILQSQDFKSNRSMKAARKNQLTHERLLQFGFAYAPPLIIAAAFSNKVFDSLESGSKMVDQITKETAPSRRGLHTLMTALVGQE